MLLLFLQLCDQSGSYSLGQRSRLLAALRPTNNWEEWYAAIPVGMFT
jgi:hypothetical protein